MTADDVGAVEADRARRWASSNARTRRRGGRLPAARLPHQRQRLARDRSEGDVVDRVHDRVVAARRRERATPAGKCFGEALDLEQRASW